jgi:hypothetical protein
VAGERKFELISRYFRERPGPLDPSVIDDRTWADLDMDAVFTAIDRTQSSVGQGCLYDMLRRPLFEPEDIAKRREVLAALGEEARARERTGRVLSRLGVQREGEIFGFLAFMRGRIEDRRRYLFLALSVLAIGVIPATILLGTKLLILLVSVALVNLVIHYRFKATVTVESPSYVYLHRLLAAADRLGRLKTAAFAKESEELRLLSGPLRKLKSRTALLMTPTGFSGDIFALLLEYVRQYFLQEVTTYFFVHNELIRRAAELARVYALVGRMDALLAVATLRIETPGLAWPEFVTRGLLLDAADLVHPLLPDPVANSVRMEGRGVIITGSNMSGKSTFLRTIGVNLLLATSVGVVYARRFEVQPMLAVTSITSRDDLLSSQSHYLVEAKRLLHILSAAQGVRPALVIIDEILSGTNSEERIVASTRILRHLSGMNCLVVAATHDRPIAAALSGVYENLHFTHLVEQEGLQFDYRLREGIVEAGNAIRLLRLLGYPPEICEGIEEAGPGLTSSSG